MFKYKEEKIMSLPTLWKRSAVAPRRSAVAPRSIFDEAFGEDGLFDRMFRDFDAMSGVITYQSADNKVMFEIECPGFNKDNINVEVADGLATIKGERKIDGSHAGMKSIYQRVTVGQPESVDAKLKDGILYIEATYPLDTKKDKIEIKVEEDKEQLPKTYGEPRKGLITPQQERKTQR